MDFKKTHTDPRVTRTRKLLRDAFVELIQEMDMQKISVNRLAERATINRVTFYLHYRDIPNMLEKMADDMIEEISTVLKETSMNHKEDKDRDWTMLMRLLEHIAEQVDFYKVILASKRIPIFRDRLLLFLQDIIVARIEKTGDNFLVAGVQKDILIWHNSSALIGTIIAWLQNDMPYTPSFLAKQYTLLHHG
ncbi:MAG: TetR-like C-terminal domain-containing protein [Bacillus sp. (in: firmicutes)]